MAGTGVLLPSNSAARVNWYDRPMRWAQLAFVEDDPRNYDPAFWLDYFRRIHADAACLSAGGCVAFYPTKIPLHYRSRWLGDTDPFGEMVQGCRSLGMNVIARTDPHAVHQDVYEAHPDWIMVDPNGNKRRHWSDKDFWVTCALGPYNFEFMAAVTEEIMTLYRVDGVFSNRWSGSGMCYCEHCQHNFHAFSGMDLPRTNNPQNPARREYIVWRQKRLFDLWRLWDSKIKAVNPDAGYIANAGGGALSELDMKTIGELAPTLFADRQARHGVMPPWTNGKNGKEYRATLGRKAIAGIFSVGLEEEYRWKDSVQNGDEIRLWVVDGIAQGLRPWVTKFNAKPIDKRWLPVVEQLYSWHYSNERYLRNEKSLARVAIVYSQQTATFYGGQQARAKVEDPALGFYQALIEARIPFEMVHDRLLDAEHLEPFRTLILPNIAALSTEQCDQIRDYVKRGGSIVATYETSLYDE
ncbi:MAG: beta-galactosidase trimerization domain-containing protein, partial [Acidobacteriaceae bacterium]|nr:beta-galactosidase trimerization domain-containing protein [Acidobacteriaceae bacterium]